MMKHYKTGSNQEKKYKWRILLTGHAFRALNGLTLSESMFTEQGAVF